MNLVQCTTPHAIVPSEHSEPVLQVSITVPPYVKERLELLPQNKHLVLSVWLHSLSKTEVDEVLQQVNASITTSEAHKKYAFLPLS